MPFFRITHYPDCPCPTPSSEEEHNQIVPYRSSSSSSSTYSYPTALSPAYSSNSRSSTSSSNTDLYFPHPVPPVHQQPEGLINGSQIAGIVSAVCSMIIMIVMVVISFLKKYVYGSSRGTSSTSTNTKTTGSVKSGDSLENNLLLLETMTGTLPSGKPASRSPAFIV